MRTTTSLEKTLLRLSHGSQQAVQNGTRLNETDTYLHVSRPVEEHVKNKLAQIQREGGGMLLLVGSAGDGKSHIISTVKATHRFDDFTFHNDATESGGPGLSAVDTLKFILEDFSDENIDRTDEKLLIAINLGKLLDLIDNEDIAGRFSRLCDVGKALADSSFRHTDSSFERIHVVSLAHEQIFEMDIDSEDEYPFNSMFMTQILEKIVAPTAENPFYQAYLADIANQIRPEVYPVLLNYRILCSKPVRESLVKLIIEASFRFNLMLTPRDFLDFVYSIIVPENIDNYKEAEDFFKSTLPFLVFGSRNTKIQRALGMLDPMKVNSLTHDRKLSELYATFEYKKDQFPSIEQDLNDRLEQILNRFYQNHQDDKPEICAMLFRLGHLFDYHSDSAVFKAFVHDLIGYWKEDSLVWDAISDMVMTAIPRQSGSYASEDLVPLNIRGAHYTLFSTVDFPTAEFHPDFSREQPHVFDPVIELSWKFEKNRQEVPLRLKINYPLYEHLRELIDGKLTTAFENDRNLAFSRFVRDVSRLSKLDSEIKIIDSANNAKTLTNKYNLLQLR